MGVQGETAAMFIVLLEFSENRGQASQHAEGHARWLSRGFDDGVFLLAGSLQPRRGGTILAHATTRDELERRVEADPFVLAKVVSAQILEVTPSRADARLEFLLASAPAAVAPASGAS